MPHPLTKFVIEIYYQTKLKFNRAYSWDNLLKINFDEYEPIWTYWILLYVNDDKVTYFDSFRVDTFQKY